jgi:hypothetical protein
MPQCSLLDVQQENADHYEMIATIPTKPGTTAARLVPELNKYYVSVSTKGLQWRKSWCMT